jgi:predicted Zn finger-like uncharacterized protein
MMLIVCPTCATAYQVQPAALGAGRTVRCAQCKNSWFATAENAAAEAVMAAGPAAAAEPPSAQPPADEFAADPGGFPAQDEPEETGRALMIADAPSIAPDHPFQDPAPSVHPFEPGPSEDVETIAARRARQTYVERKNRRTVLQRIASLPTLIVAMLALLAAALHWRVAIVRHFPQSASLYAAIGLPVNLRGLIFENVKSTGEFIDGAMVLVIEGTIVNPTRATLEVPRLRFALRNGARHEVYAWTALPSKTSIAGGDDMPFRTRLAAPPADGRDVIVRFFNKRDVTAGLQ